MSDYVIVMRLPSPFMGWQIVVKDYGEWATVRLTDDEMAEVVQVVSGKKPDESGKEPDNLLLPKRGKANG